MSTDTTAVVHPDTDAGRARLRHRRWMSWLTFGLVAAVMGSSVLDGLDVYDTWGVDDATVEAISASGTTLSVRYPTISRPALASPFSITVTRPGGFDSDVEVAIDVAYVELWDLNGIYPNPAEERSAGDRVIWTYDPPEGDVLHISYDARIEPGAQLETRRGSISVLEPGEPELTVSISTRVRP